MKQSEIRKITDSNFEQTISDSSNPIILMFDAVWCGTCHIMEPIYNELLDEYRGQVSIIKLDIDESPKAPAKYGIRELPTTLFFSNGDLIDHIYGAVPKQVVKEKVHGLLDLVTVKEPIRR